MKTRTSNHKVDQVDAVLEDTTIGDSKAIVQGNGNKISEQEARKNELERLRDILYGSQSRAIEQRMSDLEARTAQGHQEVLDTLSERLDALNTLFSNQIISLRTELNDLVGQENVKQSTALQSVQRELNARLDFQQKENTENLQIVQRSLSERLDQLVSDTNLQMQNLQRDSSERLNQINTEQSERTRTNQIEARQRTENLRTELNQINGLLSEQKLSRDELSVLFMELSHRLQREN